VVAVQGVATAGKVEVFIVGTEEIIYRVVYAAKAAGRTLVAAFAAMVEDHVKIHLNPCLVQRPYHCFELFDGVAWILGVSGMQGKKGHRIIAPEILQPLAGFGINEDDIVFVEFRYRHQFDGGYSEVLQVGDLFDKAVICARSLNAGAPVLGKAPDMQFIDNGLRQGRFQRAVFLPVEVLTAYHATGAHTVGCRLSPLPGGEHAAAGVDENFVIIVDQSPAIAAAGSIKPVPVSEILLMGEKEDMPHVTGTIVMRVEDEFMANSFCRTRRKVIDDQGCSGGVAGENRKI